MMLPDDTPFSAISRHDATLMITIIERR